MPLPATQERLDSQQRAATSTLPAMSRHRAVRLAFTLCASAACAGVNRPNPVATVAAPSRTSGTIHEDAFFAPSLGVTKRMVVYLPPSYDREPNRRYPVAYYLHGLSGTETDWISKGSIDIIADSLIAHGTPEMIIVLPDGDDGWYTTWTSPVPFATCADTVHNESPARYCVASARYDDYIANDVVHHVDETYRTRPNAQSRAIGGLSMGGYGAVSLALGHPEIFSAAASHSGLLSQMYAGPHPFAEPMRYATTVDELEANAGGFWPRFLLYWGTDFDRWRAADPIHLLMALQERKQPLPALFFDVGRDDPFADQNRAFHSELVRLGVSHHYAEYPGAHTWRYWTQHVPLSLAWMASRW